MEEFFQKRHSSGSTVTVVDFLYNLPVRKRLINPSIDMNEIRQAVIAISLSNPTISFTLRNELSGEKILQTSRSQSPTSIFSQVYGRQYCEDTLIKVDHQRDRYALTGFIAKEGSVSKEKQFLYVRRRFVRHSRLLKAVNRFFKQSLICKVTKEFQDFKNGEKRWRDPEASPSKLRKIYPIFVLNLDCPREKLDFMFEPRKTEIEFTTGNEVQNFIEESIVTVLRENNLLPTAWSEGGEMISVPTPSKGARLPDITGIVPLEMTGTGEIDKVDDSGGSPDGNTENRETLKMAMNFDDVGASLLEGARKSRPTSRNINEDEKELKRLKFLATSTPCPASSRRPSYEINKKGVFIKSKTKPVKRLIDLKADSPLSLTLLRQRFQAVPNDFRPLSKESTSSCGSVISGGRNDEGYWTDSFAKRSTSLGKRKAIEMNGAPLTSKSSSACSDRPEDADCQRGTCTHTAKVEG